MKKKKIIKIAIGFIDNHPFLNKTFVFSFLDVINTFHAFRNQYKTDELDFELGIIGAERGDIDIMRNQVALEAVRNDFEYILWLDTDMTFPSTVLPNLLQTILDNPSVDAVSGLYTYKKPPYLPHIYLRDKRGKKFLRVASFPLDKLFQVDGVGFGCLLMKTKVFKNVSYPYFKNTYKDGKLIYGEDFYFCNKSKMKILLNPSIQCGHIQNTTYGLQDYLKYNMLEVREGMIEVTKEKAKEIFSKFVD